LWSRGRLFLPDNAGLRRTRRLTNLFGWLMALGVVPELLATAGPGVLRLTVCGLIAVCLLSWLVYGDGDAVWISGLEGVVLTLGCVALARPDPLIGLLYGMTVRKAVRTRPHPYLLRVLLPLCGYLVGVLLTVVYRPQPSASAMVSHLVPSVVPLIGLVVSVVALRDTVVAANTAEVARREVTEANARLRDRAEHDPLTRVASRDHFTDQVDDKLDSAPQDQLVALLLIDLDNFKEVNDAYGHDLGDQFLVAAAERIKRAVRGAGITGRLGGDEFAVLAPGQDETRAHELGQRILAELAAPTVVAGRVATIRASVGIAMRRADQQQSAAAMLRNADIAMYEAKRSGGNGVRPFRQAMRSRLLQRQRDEADLRVALEDNQLVLYYQPIVELRSGQITGAEALLRWQHPRLGLRPPGAFIGLAESTDLIVPLGEWVLGAACEQAHRWSAEGMSLGMSVNVSSHQLSRAGFLDSLDRILGRTGLPVSSLTLELTESALAQDAALTTLRGVRERGVRVALDDFGTGYSSLSYLQ